MRKSIESGSSNAERAVRLLRQTVTIPATDLARRMKDQTFAVADYNRVSRLADECSYRDLLEIIRRHDKRRPLAA